MGAFECRVIRYQYNYKMTIQKGLLTVPFQATGKHYQQVSRQPETIKTLLIILKIPMNIGFEWCKFLCLTNF